MKINQKIFVPQISFLKLEIDKVPEIYKNSLDDYFSDLNLIKIISLLMYLIIFHMKQVSQLIAMMQIQLMEKLVFHEIEKQEEFETLLDKKINSYRQECSFFIK